MAETSLGGSESGVTESNSVRFLSLIVDEAEGHAVLDYPKAGFFDLGESEMADAVRLVTEADLGDGIDRVIAWPAMNDSRWCHALEEAGFRRAGVFMNRAAFHEAPSVDLQKLTDEDLSVYLEQHAKKIAGGTSVHHDMEQDDAAGRIFEEYRRRFANGSITPCEAILSIVDRATGRSVGSIWCSFHQQGDQQAVFIEEFEIDATHRRKGFARKCLRSLGSGLSPRTVDVISLFVQPENAPAFSLYRSLGFEPGRCEYLKRCARDPSPAGHIDSQ